MKAVVDTDILSELLRKKNEAVRVRAAAYRKQHGPLSISAMTVFEVVQGWHMIGRADKAAQYVARIGAFKVLPFESEVASLAGQISAALSRRGQSIGVADVCIAATALRHGRALVTGNTADYERICAAGFKLELDNWREDQPSTPR